MEKEHRTYIAIDLKSFFASVECVERGLSPLTTNLLVADVSRTEKTICLAVSPSLKAYGIGGRARLFEAIQRLQEVNNERRMKIPGLRFTGKSWNDEELKAQARNQRAREREMRKRRQEMEERPYDEAEERYMRGVEEEEEQINYRQEKKSSSSNISTEEELQKSLAQDVQKTTQPKDMRTTKDLLDDDGFETFDI